MTNISGSVQLSQFPHAVHTKKQDSGKECVSWNLLDKAGYGFQVSSGLFEWSHLGVRMMTRVRKVIREEMDKVSTEVLLTALQPRELWETADRWNKYGGAVFRTKGGNGAEYLLAPTHEEPIIEHARHFIQSFRDLGFSLYQIGTKFRNEARPRFGPVRGLEFEMKDSYSFDANKSGMNNSFQAHREAYNKIFKRLGLSIYEVKADSGAIGGTGSVEFMVPAEIGEDILLLCPDKKCGYGANRETAKSRLSFDEELGTPASQKKIHTPNVRSIDELVEHLGGENEKYSDPQRMIKTLVYAADGNPIVALVAGNYNINEVKLKNALGATELHLVDYEVDSNVVHEVTGALLGFAGPFELKMKNVPIIADPSVMRIRDGLTGANETDYHFIGIDAQKINPTTVADIREVEGGEPCVECGNALYTRRGIELGHVFKLGTVYSEPFNLAFSDSDQVQHLVEMGCYGIGVSRLPSSILEQEKYHDNLGMVLPRHLAPFDVVVIPAGKETENSARDIFGYLDRQGLDVMLDDRNKGPGFKFADADLIGLPLKVVVGRKFKEEKKYELKFRTGETFYFSHKELDTIFAGIKELHWDEKMETVYTNSVKA